MKKPDLAGLAAFVAIARERSFRRAAATLGVTPPTLSHTLRELETQLGIRLLNRTTRNVSPTEAGEHLLAHLDPAFEDIAAALDSLNRFRETPHGLVRINAPRNAIGLVLAPRFGELARDYPGITLEVVADEGFANIVEAGFDAGIRLGEDLQHGMRAVRVGPTCAWPSSRPRPTSDGKAGRVARRNCSATVASAGARCLPESCTNGNSARVRKRFRWP